LFLAITICLSASTVTAVVFIHSLSVSLLASVYTAVMLAV